MFQDALCDSFYVCGLKSSISMQKNLEAFRHLLLGLFVTKTHLTTALHVSIVTMLNLLENKNSL